MKLPVMGVCMASCLQPDSSGDPWSRCWVSHTLALDTTALQAMMASGIWPLARGVLGRSFTPAALPPDLSTQQLQQSQSRTGAVAAGSSSRQSAGPS